ncbi:MAG TPA: hypothetical protein VK919_03330 [Solirubrobacterales bacterium]|nr:hypothetical protein [Solirubrobacterales bacterium]
MARALIVGCGCRGCELGSGLRAAGWEVRGTTRRLAGVDRIEAAGIEAVVADPDRLLTVIDQLEGVSLVYWLLASARGAPEAVAALHGPRLARLLEEIVDTPVRGFVYEAEGDAPAELVAAGAAIVREAGARWRIPVEVVASGPSDGIAWRERMLSAADRLTAPGR